MSKRIILEVTWTDAVSEEASEPHSEVTPHLCTLTEVGWLVGESDDVLTIGMEIADGVEPGRWRLHIPKSQIVERHQLTRKRTRKSKEVACAPSS